LSDFLNSPLHVEVTFRHIVVFAVQDLLEAANGVGQNDLNDEKSRWPRAASIT
jgi:hypothetical protein